MPNANYIKGRQGEWAVKRDLERLGFSCIRAASSHGIYDIAGVRADCSVYIQVKRGEKPSPSEYKNLVDMATPQGAVKMLVWYPPALAPARVLYSNVDPIPDWCGLVRWLSGAPPRQAKLRGI